MKSQMELTFLSAPDNEAFARMVVSAFLVRVNPTLSVMAQVRTAVSEAVTNAVVHAYAGSDAGRIVLRAGIEGETVSIEVEDFGCGISDVQQAMQPFFTTQPDQERTGMGFALMQSFMDGLHVESTPGSGTRVRMIKRLDGDDDENV